MRAVVRSRASSSLLVYGRITATMRPRALRDSSASSGEVVLDRLPRGKQQQLEQRGLDRAPCREHELEVIGQHLVSRLTPVDDVTGEGRDLVRISR